MTHRGRQNERGQVLVIFAGGLVAIIAVAALVFDTGQSLVDRRTQQNAADAASLAGARYLPTANGTYQGDCDDRTGAQKASAQLQHVNAACDVAEAYLDAEGIDPASRIITVKVPPGPKSKFSNLPGHIEVQIENTRPSIFAGVLGLANVHTGAIATAENATDLTLPYSLLSLDPHGCAQSKITGAPGSSIIVGGSIHVDSDCSPDALLLSGNGAVDAPSCDAVGDIQISGGATGCDVQAADVQVSGDPLAGLAAPAIPADLGMITLEPGETKPIPNSCTFLDGSASSAITSPPGACTFGGAFDGHAYRMWPGYYPSGLQLNAGMFYMEPGIYYIGGGGISTAGGGASMRSVDAGTQTFGGGILIYNGDFPDDTYCAGGVTTGCTGDMDFNGSASTIEWQAITTTKYAGLIIFGDRDCSPECGNITLNGSNTTFDLSGTIYAANSLVKVNGSSTSSFAIQAIVYNFQVNGSGGTLNITLETDGLYHLKGVGLVE